MNLFNSKNFLMCFFSFKFDNGKTRPGIYLHIFPWPYSDHISIFKFTYTFYGTAMDISIHSVVLGCVPVCYCKVILINPIITMIRFAPDRGRNVIESRSTASKFPRCLHIRNIYSICRSSICKWNSISGRYIPGII